MRRINNLRVAQRYLAWVVIGLLVGFVLVLVDHQVEPDQPLYLLVVIGLIAGLMQALYSPLGRVRLRTLCPHAAAGGEE